MLCTKCNSELDYFCSSAAVAPPRYIYRCKVCDASVSEAAKAAAAVAESRKNKGCTDDIGFVLMDEASFQEHLN